MDSQPPVNCTLTPETDAGPYWVDTRLERSDIAEEEPGVALALEIELYELATPLVPYPGAQVDVWQANALGLYSAEPDQPRGNTEGETFLRGFQISDQEGSVRFRTIYPGWYEQRTLHIHVRVRAPAGAETGHSFITQIFFDEGLNEAVLAEGPYNQRAERDTTNAEDGIYLPELIASTNGSPATGVEASFRICLSGFTAG